MQVAEGSDCLLSCGLPPEHPCLLSGGLPPERPSWLSMGISVGVFFITIGSIYYVCPYASLGHFHICR